MKINVNGIIIYLGFKHKTDSKVNKRHTVCYIKPDDISRDTIVTVAICSPKDNFCKSIGRKVALKKALKETLFNKTERKYIWQEYFQYVGQTF